MADLTYDEVVEIVAKGLCPQYDSLPERATYLQQKATNGERYDKADVRGDARDILRALSAAGIALVPREATEGSQRLESMQRALNRLLLEGAGDHASAAADECWEMWSDEAKALYAAAIAAGEIREKSRGNPARPYSPETLA